MTAVPVSCTSHHSDTIHTCSCERGHDASHTLVEKISHGSAAGGFDLDRVKFVRRQITNKDLRAARWFASNRLRYVANSDIDGICGLVPEDRELGLVR